MRSACPTAMITSRLTLRSLPTRSSSLLLASGRIAYRSKSKLTIEATVTFPTLDTGGAGRGAGAGLGGSGVGSGVDAQPANASRAIADSAVLSFPVMLPPRIVAAVRKLQSFEGVRVLKLLFLLLTYSAIKEYACPSRGFRTAAAALPRRAALRRPTRATRARARPSTRGATPRRSKAGARAGRKRPRTGRRIFPARATRSRRRGRARARRAAWPRPEPGAPASPRRRRPPPWREARRCATPGGGPGGCCSRRRRFPVQR